MCVCKLVELSSLVGGWRLLPALNCVGLVVVVVVDSFSRYNRYGTVNV